MRAWQVTQYGPPEKALELREVAPPEPGPGEIRVRVEMAALGMPDVFMCSANYAFEPPLPFSPGQEILGTVTASGPGAPPVGSRVIAVTGFIQGFGGFAEEALALSGSTFLAPESLPDEDAAGFVIPFHTAWLGLVQRGSLREEDTVVVLGAAGGTGAAAVALAHALGNRVIACARGPDKARFARELGADLVIDPEDGDFVEAIREATDGRGADIVYDPVGGEMFKRSLRCLASEGRLLAIGFASGSWGDARTAGLVNANTSVVGVYVGAYDHAQVAWAHESCLALQAEGRLPSIVGRVIGFDEIPGALGDLANRRVVGKVVARVSSAEPVS